MELVCSPNMANSFLLSFLIGFETDSIELETDTDAVIWTIVEVCLATVSACLPTLRPLFNRKNRPDYRYLRANYPDARSTSPKSYNQIPLKPNGMGSPVEFWYDLTDKVTHRLLTWRMLAMLFSLGRYRNSMYGQIGFESLVAESTLPCQPWNCPLLGLIR